MSNETISKLLADAGCLWINDNPLVYHAQLVSGLHSNGYINMRNIYNSNKGILSLETIIELMSKNLNDEYYQAISKDPDNLVTAGAAYGGIIPAYLMAKALWTSTIWTEKQDDNSQVSKFMLQNKKVILVEDVLTTGSTIQKSMKAISGAGGTVVDPIVCIVNRSGSNHVEGRKIFSGMSLFIKNYKADVCPYCQKGSVALKPKFGDNWNKLIKQGD